jgi:hypothetical protein
MHDGPGSRGWLWSIVFAGVMAVAPAACGSQQAESCPPGPSTYVVSVVDPDQGTCVQRTGCVPDIFELDANCVSSCSGLTEAQCLTTAGCHAAYLGKPGPVGGEEDVFMACWEVAPPGAMTGACQGLDAATCERHDHCRSYYLDPRFGKKPYRDCEDTPAPPAP